MKVKGSVEIENTKTLQHRDSIKSNLKKFVLIEVSDVGSKTEKFTTLTSLPSCDKDFMQELKVRPTYI